MPGLNRRKSNDPGSQGFNEPGGKYRSRGYVEKYPEYDDLGNPQNSNSPEMEEDVGPMSLTINTKQFDENYNENQQRQQEEQDRQSE